MPAHPSLCISWFSLKVGIPCYIPDNPHLLLLGTISPDTLEQLEKLREKMAPTG